MRGVEVRSALSERAAGTEARKKEERHVEGCLVQTALEEANGPSRQPGLQGTEPGSARACEIRRAPASCKRPLVAPRASNSPGRPSSRDRGAEQSRLVRRCLSQARTRLVGTPWLVDLRRRFSREPPIFSIPGTEVPRIGMVWR